MNKSGWGQNVRRRVSIPSSIAYFDVADHIAFHDTGLHLPPMTDILSFDVTCWLDVALTLLLATMASNDLKHDIFILPNDDYA